MIRVGLVGLGFMGNSHFNNYKLLEENGVDVKLVAICDVDPSKLEGNGVKGNLDIGEDKMDLSKFNLYSDMEEMIKNENLDYVDLTLPTYIHSSMAVKAMELGVNVFCEKPMAISSKECELMIQASVKTGKSLMIGQTLRYWNFYEYLKETIESGKFGNVISGYFFRGGATPIWSWENWLLQNDKAGGALLDQHIHDVDAINWLFGMPEAVSSSGKVVFENSGYDAVSTNYMYPDGKVINAQDDWSINGDGFGFEMNFRVNFEKGALIYKDNKIKECPVDGTSFYPELDQEDAYYKELRIFNEVLQNKRELDLIALLKSHMQTIEIAEKEVLSANKKGELVKFK